jgi:hypothetical protein
MVGLTLFAELAAAVACGGFALSLAALAGVQNRVTIAEVGAVIGFFIGFLTQLGLPIVALPVAIVAVAALDRWIDRRSKTQVSPTI